MDLDRIPRSEVQSGTLKQPAVAKLSGSQRSATSLQQRSSGERSKGPKLNFPIEIESGKCSKQDFLSSPTRRHSRPENHFGNYVAALLTTMSFGILIEIATEKSRG